MNSNLVFALIAIVITTVFFNVLVLFELPVSLMDWLISDVILGIILYMSYLAIVITRSAPKNKFH